MWVMLAKQHQYMLTVYCTRWWIRQRFMTVFVLIIDTTYSHHNWCVYVVYPNVMTIPGAMLSLGTWGGGFCPRGGGNTTNRNFSSSSVQHMYVYNFFKNNNKPQFSKFTLHKILFSLKLGWNLYFASYRIRRVELCGRENEGWTADGRLLFQLEVSGRNSWFSAPSRKDFTNKSFFFMYWPNGQVKLLLGR